MKSKLNGKHGLMLIIFIRSWFSLPNNILFAAGIVANRPLYMATKHHFLFTLASIYVVEFSYIYLKLSALFCLLFCSNICWCFHCVMAASFCCCFCCMIAAILLKLCCCMWVVSVCMWCWINVKNVIDVTSHSVLILKLVMVAKWNWLLICTYYCYVWLCLCFVKEVHEGNMISMWVLVGH